jgi:hypothetical protein
MRIAPTIAFVLIEFKSLASSDSFDPFQDKTLLTIAGLFILGWLFLGITGEIRGSTKSAEDKGCSILIVLFSVVAILYLAYDCSSH